MKKLSATYPRLKVRECFPNTSSAGSFLSSFLVGLVEDKLSSHSTRGPVLKYIYLLTWISHCSNQQTLPSNKQTITNEVNCNRRQNHKRTMARRLIYLMRGSKTNLLLLNTCDADLPRWLMTIPLPSAGHWKYDYQMRHSTNMEVCWSILIKFPRRILK